ncbi:MAG: HPr family phosphocarrier protein [Kiritimatiellia bacterium]
MDPEKKINLTPPELKAALEHQGYLARQYERSVTLEEAIADFINRFREAWLREKMRRDNAIQKQEIEKHKYLRSEKQGFDIGRAVAAEDWCRNFAATWRVWRDSLQNSGFECASATVHNPRGLHGRPGSQMIQHAARFNADIFVHKQHMTCHNFVLNNKPFINLASILTLLSMGISCGDMLELIARGPEARVALGALKTFIETYRDEAGTI